LTQAEVYRQLGELQGLLSGIKETVERTEEALATHTAADADNFAILRADMKVLTDTVDRIKKPVEAFISLRNVLIGGAAILAAIGAVFSGVPHSLFSWITSWGH